MPSDTVIVREEIISIPTYGIGKPDKNPMFLEKRVYQGSSGVVYPHPIVESILDEKEDRPYQAVFLENRYLNIMLLPELGGRVQMAQDKTNGYHFVYYNQVIKPALVGLTGPWISGGIEFNWPQHHRPSTFAPVEYTIEENADGSKTVWMSELEVMFRTKGMAGFTLHPNRALLQIDVQLYNRTPLPQTFLWWANPAVHVNDNYQSIFPPDVHAVMDHGKRDVSDFPIATGTYYKVSYAPGTDISRYKNIPVPTSYMAHHSDYDFLGSYDHGQGAGMMHIANHHVVPGKKQWTWGNGDFGRAWDRHLTDEDGPYIELMCGAYTDNQPDFSWISPGEEKRFSQVFMPYKGIGGAKNANREAVVNLDIQENTAQIGVYVTSPRIVRIQLQSDTAIIFERDVDLSPETYFTENTALPEGTPPQALALRVLDGDREVIAFTPPQKTSADIPDPASAARPPAEIASNEELFLNGLHLEQYRHATYEPEAYYLEAIRRDPLDSRCNNAMGLLLLRRGKFTEAERYFRTATESLTRRNPNPADGEPFYNLGMALRLQGRFGEAFDAFYKSVWNAAWQDSSYFELARLACRSGSLEEALDLVERALDRNARHHQARHLKIALLRHLGRTDAAQAEITISLRQDRLDLGALYERHLLDESGAYRDAMGSKASNTIEIALDYAHAGLFSEAIALLSESPNTDPMVRYFSGWIHTQRGDLEAARASFAHAAALSPDYCFPNQVEAVLALETAIQVQPNDARAPYYLGNFWYAHRRYDEAIACWEQACDLDPAFPTVYRNLGLAYMNKRHDSEMALQAYQQAFELDPMDARVFFEYDQLLKRRNLPPAERLAVLESHRHLVDQRDDLTLERISLLNLLGRHGDALDVLMSRHFHPWEGGEGKVTGQYVLTLVELAKRCLIAEDYASAVVYLERAQVYPENLGEGKLYGAQENDIHYLLGCVYEGLQEPQLAQASFTQASDGLSEPSMPMFYNDQPPHTIYYQGKARQKLGQTDSAASIFMKLIDYGTKHLDDTASIDYFAVSLPDFLVFDEDLRKRNQSHCHYMMGMGFLGLEKSELAAAHFDIVLSLNHYHHGAVTNYPKMISTE